MTFKDIGAYINSNYNSRNNDLIKEFYVPVLKEAKRYDRIAGYFNSSSLAVAAKGIGEFIATGGHMRILCGTQLSSEDLKIINDASDAKKIICQHFLDDLNNIENELINNHIKMLGWMIAKGILEIKIGINLKENDIEGGILHDKKGILFDTEDDYVEDKLNHCIVFMGSNNETAAGWALNSESFAVFKGWEYDEFAKYYINEFSTLWNNENDKLLVMDIPEATKKSLIKKAPKNDFEMKKIISKYHNNKKDDRELFPHQKEAINAWFENNKKGILEMATGTGKTFTALNCLLKLSQTEEKLFTVIACPYTHLADQWFDELVDFNFDEKIYKIFGSGNSNWKKDLSKLILRGNKESLNKAIIVTTHDTFSSDFFKEKIKKLNVNLFLIADEMHHLGAEGYSEGLLNSYIYRLGLSATPEKFMDEEATEMLLDYFGGVVSTFSIYDALHTDNPKTELTYLTPYNYYPIKVTLTATESRGYDELSSKIRVLYHSDNLENKEDSLNSLYRERRKILNTAEDKYVKFRNLIHNYEGNLDHLIVFCSYGQLDKILKILKEEGVTPRHRFTSKEKTSKDKNLGGISQRQDLLNKFASGEYKALVAIKCLDEGVDVPSADKVIIMSSTTNPMEYIQRRGRVLRRFPGKDLAYIYDMAVVPDENESFRDNVILKERERLEDFILSANNKNECNKKLRNWGVLS